MRHTMLGIFVFASACSSEPVLPTIPSGLESVAGRQAAAKDNTPNVVVTFTKWLPLAGQPTLEGVTAGDVPGTFAGQVLDFVEFDNGTVAKVEARYEVIANDAVHSFVALVNGTQNNQTQKAVLNGTIVEGWLVGARVHATFDVISPCPDFEQSVCFTGVIKVMAGSAK